MGRYINPRPAYGDDAMDPLISGELTFYQTKSDTLKNIYLDEAETIPSSNPVILDASGRVPNIFFSGVVRVKLTDKDEVIIWDIDPVTQDSATVQSYAEWDSTNTYDEFDIAGVDGVYYRSLIDDNTDNNPTTSPTAWEQIYLGRIYNVNVSYVLNDIVTEDGQDYRSLVSPNLGNALTDTASWAIYNRPFHSSDLYLAGRTYNTGDQVYFNSGIWRSKVDTNTGNTPATGANWEAMAPVEPLPPYAETIFTASSTLDFQDGNSQSLTFTGNTTVVITSPPSGKSWAMNLTVIDGSSFTITWPGTVTWSGGVAPILTLKDTVILTTDDGGTEYFGYYGGTIV